MYTNKAFNPAAAFTFYDICLLMMNQLINVNDNYPARSRTCSRQLKFILDLKVEITQFILRSPSHRNNFKNRFSPIYFIKFT